MARNIFSHGATMEPLEDMFPRRTGDGAARVAHCEDGPVADFATSDANAAARAGIFSRVLVQIFEDQRHVMPFCGNVNIVSIVIHLDVNVYAVGISTQV